MGIGDKIRIYKANKIIPKVHDNLTCSNTWTLPDQCPNCNEDVEIHNENGSKTLYCTNPNCSAKLLGRLTHFVSKNAINIDGLSEQTLQKFIDLKWLKTFADIFHLSDYRTEMYSLDGLGKKSVDKLLINIEKSRSTTLDRFIYAISIPGIGKSTSKDIAKECKGNIEQFEMILTTQKEKAFTNLDGFGEETNKSLLKWWSENQTMFHSLSKYFNFDIPNKNKFNIENKLDGKTFCITGSLQFYKNRAELVSIIESFGGKVTNSVSNNTDYLINNNKESISSKNIKAKKLNIPILTENDFKNMIKNDGRNDIGF